MGWVKGRNRSLITVVLFTPVYFLLALNLWLVCLQVIFLTHVCVCGSPAEGATEEPGDEGPDGSDEEPVVGCQRHAHTQEIMLRPFLRRLLRRNNGS